MSVVTLNMSFGTPPYVISVKKENEGYERYRGLNNGNEIVFEPATDGVLAVYNVTITDSKNCTNNGNFALLCGSPQIYPDAQIEVIQPTCLDNGLIPGSVRIYNSSNTTSYKICYGKTNFDCACSPKDGTITSGTDAIIPIFAPAVGTSETTTIRLFNGDSCSLIKDFTFTMTTPTCQAACLMNITLGFPVC